MSRHTLSFIFIFILVIMIPALYAADKTDDKTEPADPDIVLPSVVLEIEDVSIENIDAALPAETELLTPEREIPLPDAEVMEATEPVPDTDITAGDNTKVRESEPSLISEVVLGAGSANNIMSDISFYKLGDLPRFTLLFSHEMLDGFGFHEASTGYSLREDSLQATLKTGLGPVDTELSGLYTETERGLQDTGDYFSQLLRFIESSAIFSGKPSDIMKLYTEIESSFTSMSLSGIPAPSLAADYPPLELLAGITLGTEFTFDSALLGLSARYKYRYLTGNDDYQLHRVNARAYFSIDLPRGFTVNGDLGYFYSTQDIWFVPFSLAVTLNPFETFSFHAAGGFRVEENDLNSLWKEFEYMELPADLPDNSGYFGKGGIKLNFGNTYILSLVLGVSADSVYADYGNTVDSVTGLFPLSVSHDIMEWSGELGFRINIAKSMYIDMKTTGYIFSDPAVLPRMNLLIEGMIADEEGKFGGNFSVSEGTNFSDPLQLPVTDIGLFLKISDNIRIIAEGYDLLYPLLQDERYSQAPYISPGIRGALKMHINF